GMRGGGVRVDGGAHVTLLVEPRRGYATLCRLLTAAHAGTRRPGREDREPLPPSTPLETVAELTEGLVCLSGCSRRGLALLDANAAAPLAGAFRHQHLYLELPRPSARGGTPRARPPRGLPPHLRRGAGRAR